MLENACYLYCQRTTSLHLCLNATDCLFPKSKECMSTTISMCHMIAHFLILRSSCLPPCLSSTHFQILSLCKFHVSCYTYLCTSPLHSYKKLIDMVLCQTENKERQLQSRSKSCYGLCQTENKERQLQSRRKSCYAQRHGVPLLLAGVITWRYWKEGGID